MSEILVIGHRNPDTDAICSAIGYAEFKRRTGMAEAVAARCGDTNDRIDFVLKTFGVPAPKFVADVSPKISDVMQPRVLSVRPDSTAAEALRLMDQKNLRLLPVLDEARKCRGLLSLFKLSKFLFPAVNRNAVQEHNSREVLSSLASLAQTLDGQLIVGFDTEREQELILMIGAMGLEILRGPAGVRSAGEVVRHCRRPLGHSKRGHSRRGARGHRHRRHRPWSPKPWRRRTSKTSASLPRPTTPPPPRRSAAPRSRCGMC